MHVLHSIRLHSPTLVVQASLVSSELVRVAILWLEQWHEAIDDASKHWFTAVRNADAVYALLHPLHQMMDRGAQTNREMHFAATYGHELREAGECLRKYMQTPPNQRALGFDV